MASEVSARSDPRYVKGMQHLQAGAWQDAIRCFEELARDYPDGTEVLDALHRARLIANVDSSGAHIRAKRWGIPWRGLLARLAIVLVVLFVGIQLVSFVRGYVGPMVAQARIERHRAQLLSQGLNLLQAGKLDEAESHFAALLAEVPDHEEALEGLAEVGHQRELLALYEGGLALQEAQDWPGALAAFTDLAVRAPGYADVSDRIYAIGKQQELERLFAVAEEEFAAGRLESAKITYDQMRELSMSFRADAVADRLVTINLALGNAQLEVDPPSQQSLSKALDYFAAALALQPRQAEALLEQELAGLFISGQDRYYSGRWNSAIAALRPVFDKRPTYLRGMAVSMLYDAYIQSGDEYDADGDASMAYEQYRKASVLPVEDTALAEARMSTVLPRMTPTAVPTATFTPRPAPPSQPGGAGGAPAATPMPTPKPFDSYRNKIIFVSEDPAQRGFWVMDPDGSNRQYLGNTQALRDEYDALEEKLRLSPDERYRLFVQDVANVPQIFVEPPKDPARGGPAPIQLTDLNVCYDPVWSPDGSRIAFVSAQDASDDIWIMSPDGSGRRNLTQDREHFEKHPAWSPDSTRLVYWTDRDTGRPQIWIMDADGRNARNISNSVWAETDPIWVR